MDIAAISPSLLQSGPDQPASKAAATPEQTAEAARQFEAILLRQFVNESLKGLVPQGEAGQVYGFFLTDSLADSLSKGGGFGLSSVIQSQLCPKSE